MLNPTHPKSLNDSITRPYTLPEVEAASSTQSNRDFSTHAEYRLQEVYGKEVWIKLFRSGLTPEKIQGMDVLEICAGTGFLTYHILNRCLPGSLAVNDISANEIEQAKKLINSRFPDANPVWVKDDFYNITDSEKYDLVIGNSFIHHFHDVGALFSKIRTMLKPGGCFISLHEPTLLASILESSKYYYYPLAVIFPQWINEVIRKRYKGIPTSTDLWLFDPDKLEKLAIASGFEEVKLLPWHLFRPVVVQKYCLHLDQGKQELSPSEEKKLQKAIAADSFLNKVLPKRCFGSVTVICRK